jgi:hypothetical protein
MWLYKTCHFTSVPKRRVMKAYWGEGIMLHSFLTSPIHVGECSGSPLALLTPVKDLSLPFERRLGALHSRVRQIPAPDKNLTTVARLLLETCTVLF